jgi:superfamily II DNA or RNA helicase
MTLKERIIGALYACQVGDEYVSLKTVYEFFKTEDYNQKAAIRGTFNTDIKNGQKTFIRSPDGGAYKLRYANSVVEDINFDRKAKREIKKKIDKVFNTETKSNVKELSLLERYEMHIKRLDFNNDAFKDYMSKNRKHQNDAIDSINNKKIGQITIPTGTGKTRVQIAIHLMNMIENLKNGKVGVHVIAAHRLLLCRQLMDDFKDMCFKCGIPFNVLYIGSSRVDDKEVFEKYFNQGVNSLNYEQTFTTTNNVVKEFYDKTMSVKRNLVIVSTYHSFDRMASIDKIDLTTFDEAHTTTSEDFTNNINLINSKIDKQYFFTATRKVCGEDGGMNDIDMYGEVLHDVSPSEMIEAGEICKLKVHSMMLQDNGIEGIEKNETMLIRTIIEAFKEHKKHVKKHSCKPESIGAKMLVSTKGSEEMNMIQSNPDFQAFCRNNNIKFFSYSTEYGSFEDFVKNYNRNEVYDHMVSLKNEDDCILLHIDILTEGINLPSITGVLILRHLNEIKLFQSIGRALRLLEEDRDRLYNGEISPEDIDKFIKPYAYLILPLHFTEMSSSSSEMRGSIEKVIREYGVPEEEFLPPEEFGGEAKDYLDVITNRDEHHRRNREYPLRHVIEDILSEKMVANLKIETQEEYNDLINILENL